MVSVDVKHHVYLLIYFGNCLSLSLRIAPNRDQTDQECPFWELLPPVWERASEKSKFRQVIPQLPEDKCNQVHCVRPGPWPLTFSFLLSFLLFRLGGSFMTLVIWSVGTCALGQPRLLSPSVPAEAGCLLVWAVVWAPVCLIQARAYTVSWLV